jgi:hypothetical protein
MSTPLLAAQGLLAVVELEDRLIVIWAACLSPHPRARLGSGQLCSLRCCVVQWGFHQLVRGGAQPPFVSRALSCFARSRGLPKGLPRQNRKGCQGRRRSRGPGPAVNARCRGSGACASSLEGRHLARDSHASLGIAPKAGPFAAPGALPGCDRARPASEGWW